MAIDTKKSNHYDLNGHSDSTGQNYYIKKRRRQDSHDSQQHMFDVLSMQNSKFNNGWFAEDNRYEKEQYKSSADTISYECNLSSPLFDIREIQSPPQWQWNTSNIEWGPRPSRV
jgi:hypothetical protein